MRRFLKIAGVLFAVAVGLVFALVLAAGVAIQTGHVANTRVVAGNKLPSRVTKLVADRAEFFPGERIRFFYSAAMTPGGDGNVLTDRRVISYVDDGSDAWCEWLMLDDVVAAEFAFRGDFFEDSEIVVAASDGTLLTLYVSAEADGDERFLDAIREAAGLDE